MKDFGIHVTLVAPGSIRTDFLRENPLKQSSTSLPDYAAASEQIRQTFSQYNHRQPGDPAGPAKAMLALAAQPNPPLRFNAGSDAVQMVEARIADIEAEVRAARSLSALVDSQWS